MKWEGLYLMLGLPANRIIYSGIPPPNRLVGWTSLLELKMDSSMAVERMHTAKCGMGHVLRTTTGMLGGDYFMEIRCLIIAKRAGIALDGIAMD